MGMKVGSLGWQNFGVVNIFVFQHFAGVEIVGSQIIIGVEILEEPNFPGV